MLPHVRPVDPPTPVQRRARRAATVAAAPLGAVAVWAAATQVLGIDVRAPEMAGTPPTDIPVSHVVSSSIVAAVAAWALLAGLERWLRRRAWLVWYVAAKAVLALSLWLPVTGTGLTTSNRAALVALHVVVATVVVTGFGTTSPRLAADRADADTEELRA